jgi:hypothetical protein
MHAREGGKFLPCRRACIDRYLWFCFESIHAASTFAAANLHTAMTDVGKDGMGDCTPTQGDMTCWHKWAMLPLLIV